MTRTVNVCPSAVVEAPFESVWELMTTPEGVNAWVDGVVVSAEPPGRFVPGQRLDLVAPAFGRNFAVTIEVLEVEPEARRLHLLATLPLGVVNDETISMADAGGGRTFVQFG